MTNIKYIETPYIGINIQIEMYEDNKVFYFLICTLSEKCFDHFPTTQEVADFRNEVVKPYNNIQSFNELE